MTESKGGGSALRGPSTLSRGIAAVSPLLLVVAVLIRGTAGTILAIACAVIAIPWLTVLYVQRRRGLASGDVLPKLP